MAERRHPFERYDVAAREALPLPSKKICRPFPGGNTKHWNDEVARNEGLVFNEQNLLPSFDESRDEVDGFRLRRARLSREAFWLPARRGPTARAQRACAATRHARGAHEGAQLHDGLVVVAGVPRRDERPRERA